MNVKEYLQIDENEKPLDRIITDGGMCAIFRTIGCIGDSLSSGEFETVDSSGKKHYHDFYEYSWGQYIARTCGCKVCNMSTGGMTAFKYRMHFADEKGLWDDDHKFQAYIIALGVNDVKFYLDKIGSFDEDVDLNDFENNDHTFIGDYAYIVQRLKVFQPNAKIFLITLPIVTGTDSIRLEYTKAIRDIASRFDNTYLIDLEAYAPIYDENFHEMYYAGGHLNAMGYIISARMIESYIDYIIRHNPDDFKKVQFIGTQYENGIFPDEEKS